jgi:hypothetical protein
MFRQRLLQAVTGLAVLYALPALAADSAAKAIVGNTVHGTEDDGEFYDYYAPNGTVTSRLVGGDTAHGRWSIRNGNMCLNFPDDQPGCYRVTINGSAVTMTDVATGVVFNNQLIPGNAGQ